MPICHCVIVRKCVRIRIGLKLILGLAIIAAGTLASCYVDALWLNNIALAVVVVIRVGEKPTLIIGRALMTQWCALKKLIP